MNVKLTLLFALIAAVEFVNSVPLLDDLIGGRNEGSERPPNPDGLLSGLDEPVDPILCGLGLGYNSNNGLLKGLKPITDDPIYSLGLGDCKNCGKDGDCGCDGHELPTEHGNSDGDCDSNRHCERCDRGECKHDGGNGVKIRGTINDGGDDCEKGQF